jgi:N-acyl-D-amino-acid deacylase
MFDRLIKGGTVVDGTGAAPFTADVAIQDGRIVEVGHIRGTAKEVVDATGLLVAPGWVDVHTHYDGQVTWDDQIAPSFWHGVSTVVFGNCGVGFAPCKADKRDWLIQMMEGVEDIPGTALSDGIKWNWETFPEYLDAIDRPGLAIDIGSQIAHGPLRAYVMGERGALNEAATDDEIAAMAHMVGQAQKAGALGFSTSRTVVHRAMDGEPVPGTFAAIDELRAIARAVAQSGHGVMEVVPAGLLGEDLVNPPKEIAWMNQVSAETGCPITFLTGQNHVQPTFWREQLEECGRQRVTGANVIPQMFCRAIGIMVCLESKLHPFMRSPSYQPLMERPFRERVRALQENAELRKRIALEGVNDVLGGTTGFSQWRGVYPLGTPADYEPAKENSISAIAKREGRDPREVAMDVLLSDDGKGFLHRPVMGYADGNLDPTYELLASPLTVPGGSDGGAHVATVCDAGAPTFLLSYWARDRVRGPKLSIEHLVRKQTWDSAQLFGMTDRGRIAAGLKADINLIDFDNLGSNPLHMIHDLPTGAPRLMQTAHGYVGTMVSGEFVTRFGEETGNRPGKLVRGGQH